MKRKATTGLMLACLLVFAAVALAQPSATRESRWPAGAIAHRDLAYVANGHERHQHAKFPAQIEDCKAAVCWLRAHADQWTVVRRNQFTDVTGTGQWAEVTRLEIPADRPHEHRFPDSFGAYWLRLIADQDNTATATCIYE